MTGEEGMTANTEQKSEAPSAYLSFSTTNVTLSTCGQHARHSSPRRISSALMALINEKSLHLPYAFIIYNLHESEH